MIIIQVKFTGAKEQKTQTNLTFSTKDIIDPLILEQMEKSHGWISFSIDKLKKSVEEAMNNKTVGINEHGKSPSQRLRGAIFQKWEEGKMKEFDSAEEAYIKKMNQIIKYINMK